MKWSNNCFESEPVKVFGKIVQAAHTEIKTNRTVKCHFDKHIQNYPLFFSLKKPDSKQV